jgi:hypothetical protein
MGPLKPQISISLLCFAFFYKIISILMEIIFMHSKRFFPLLVTSLFLCSCKFSCKMGAADKTGSNTVSGPSVVNGALISNGIDITGNGVKIKSATLKLDGGVKVPDDNVINLNQKIYLVMELEDNWTIADGKSFIGASEKITTSKGYEILNAADLFKDNTLTGFDPNDTKYIQLDAVITKSDPSVSYYKVDFRVWDKKGDAEIKGSYKFYIQAE